VLDDLLAWRRDNVDRRWGIAKEEDSRTAEVVIRLPVEDSERLLLKHWDHLRFSAHFVLAAIYVATPKLCRVAAASVAEAPDPPSLFRHLSHLWGVRTYDHPGITRETQILALEPYLHLIAVSDLKVIADACNRRGWFALRERLLDAQLDKPHYIRSAENASIVFDSLVAQKRYYWVGIEIDNALSMGISWGDYLSAMRAWFTLRQTFEALQLLAAALAHKGSRRDLPALEICEDMPRKAAEALITDVTFEVYRRSPE
jgi:hypothetical protein